MSFQSNYAGYNILDLFPDGEDSLRIDPSKENSDGVQRTNLIVSVRGRDGSEDSSERAEFFRGLPCDIKNGGGAPRHWAFTASLRSCYLSAERKKLYHSETPTSCYLLYLAPSGSTVVNPFT